MEFEKGDDVFCSDDIKKRIYYTGKYTNVVYDIAPVMPGHSLFIPKRHVVDISELTKDELLDLFEAMDIVRPVLLKHFGDSSMSYDITSQIGDYSGMSVKHVHIHFIPRKKDDPYQHSEGDVYQKIDTAKRLTEQEYEKVVTLLRKELKWSDEESEKSQ